MTTKIFDILLGLVFGDEGKGKIVDGIAYRYDIIARFQGGPNAGHTIYGEIEGKKIKFVLHHIPSGILHEGKINFIGKGVLLHLPTLQEEIKKLTDYDIPVFKRLRIARNCNLILPTHKLLELVEEHLRGKDKIGSTLRAIAQAYEDFYGRRGVTIGDIIEHGPNAYTTLVGRHKRILGAYEQELQTLGINLDEYIVEEFGKFDASIKFFKKHANILVDNDYAANAFYEGKKILAEGAQGGELSVGGHNWPFVTSSYVSSASACEQLGIAPVHIRKVIGVFKIYSTKVGGGSFLEIIEGPIAQKLQSAGEETGSTTGRPRSVGWNNIEVLKDQVRRNGVTELIITKCDVPFLVDIPSIGIYYKNGGEKLTLKEIPLVPSSNPDAPLGTSRTVSDFLKFIEEQIGGVKVTHVSNGKYREDFIETISPLFEV